MAEIKKININPELLELMVAPEELYPELEQKHLADGSKKASHLANDEFLRQRGGFQQTLRGHRVSEVDDYFKENTRSSLITEQALAEPVTMISEPTPSVAKSVFGFWRSAKPSTISPVEPKIGQSRENGPSQSGSDTDKPTPPSNRFGSR